MQIYGRLVNEYSQNVLFYGTNVFFLITTKGNFKKSTELHIGYNVIHLG